MGLRRFGDGVAVAVVSVLVVVAGSGCSGPSSVGGTEGGPAVSSPPSSSPPSPSLPPTTAAAHARPPARTPGELIDLTNWYLTLPIGNQGDPDTVTQPALAGYSSSFFHLNDAADGVVFTARAGGVTTKGSGYPRSELREMDGAKKASWSNTSGTHVMTVRQAITVLPRVKPDVVAAQIHDADSDVLEIRLIGQRLSARYNDNTDAVLDPAYQLGTPYDLTITAANSRIDITYNGSAKASLPVVGSNWYFKAGCYVQSNPSKGDDANAIGQVVLYALSVKHSN